jgi:iron complex outermembrane receptor protein
MGVRTACLFTWTVSVVTASAFQQPPSTPAPPRIQEQVEVIATKTPEPVHDVPAPIEVISGDSLRDRGARTLSQALALAAGVDVSSGGDNGPASTVPEFRGLREFDAFLLVVDDVPWGGAFNPALATLSLQDVERIEILRGPAPVTYGATSFVGAIHVVHKPGTANRSYATARAGNFGSGGGSADLAIPPFGAWRSRLTVEAEREGYADDRTSYTRGHALWRSARADADRRMWFSGDLNWLDQNPASPHPREGPSLSPLVPLDANQNPDGAFLNETRIAFVYGFDRPFHGDTRWATTASFSHSTQDAFGGFLSEVSNTPDNARGLRQTIDLNDLYADTHFTWPSTSTVRFIAGADFLHGMGDAKGATFDYTVPLSGIPVPQVAEPAALNLGVEDRREFFGGYGLVEWRPTPRWMVSGGLRLNVTFEERGGGDEAQAGAAGEEDAGQTQVRPSGSVGAMYTLWSHDVEYVRAYGNYRSTFKPAAFDFGLGEEEGAEEGLLDPETANDYEGGLKVRTLDGRLDLDVDVFRLDFENLVTATVVNGLPALQNSGSTRFQGIELASDVQVTNYLAGRLTYSFHDSTFVDFVEAFDGVPLQLAGNRLEMSARHLFGAGLVYAPGHGVFAHGLVKYVGSRYLNKRNTALAGAYAIVDLGGGYRFGRWEVRWMVITSATAGIQYRRANWGMRSITCFLRVGSTSASRCVSSGDLVFLGAGSTRRLRACASGFLPSSFSLSQPRFRSGRNRPSRSQRSCERAACSTCGRLRIARIRGSGSTPARSARSARSIPSRRRRRAAFRSSI